MHSLTRSRARERDANHQAPLCVFKKLSRARGKRFPNNNSLLFRDLLLYCYSRRVRAGIELSLASSLGPLPRRRRRRFDCREYSSDGVALGDVRPGRPRGRAAGRLEAGGHRERASECNRGRERAVGLHGRPRRRLGGGDEGGGAGPHADRAEVTHRWAVPCPFSL